MWELRWPASEFLQVRAETRAEERRAKTEAKTAEELGKKKEVEQHEEVAKNTGLWAKTKSYGQTTWTWIKGPAALAFGVIISKTTELAWEAVKAKYKKTA